MSLPTHSQNVIREALYQGARLATEDKLAGKTSPTDDVGGDRWPDLLAVWVDLTDRRRAYWIGVCQRYYWSEESVSEGWPAFVDAYWAAFDDEGAQAAVAQWQAEAGM